MLGGLSCFWLSGGVRNKICTQCLCTCLASRMQQIFANGQVESASSLKVGMPRQIHDVVFPQPLGEPTCQTGATQVMELTVFDFGFGYNLLELASEVIDWANAVLNRPLTATPGIHLCSRKCCTVGFLAFLIVLVGNFLFALISPFLHALSHSRVI